MNAECRTNKYRAGRFSGWCFRVNPFTIDQIRHATDGKFIDANPQALIRSICTDSRDIQPGCLFIALKGENHNGHHHLQAAAAGGAVAALVDEQCDATLPLIRVTDTRKAMGQIAAQVRRQLRGTVIAVAGSNGKTGTKHLIHAALSTTRNGTASPKSFNNDIGVPLTIFSADPMQDYLVLEIGTNHPGEILNLTHIARPDVAVITNIGAEHLEFLGDLNGVTTENAQIIAGMNPNGMLVVNGDCPPLLAAVAGYPGRIVRFGLGLQNDLHPTDIQCVADGVKFRLHDRPVSVPLMGRHIAVNARAAFAVGRHLGVRDADIIAGLSTAKGPVMRLELQTAGNIRILNDAYNANPHSMQAALETLRDLDTTGRKIAILGDMRELGATADGYHRDIGLFAAQCGLDHLVCIGEKAKIIADTAFNERVHVSHYGSANDCAAKIAEIVRDGDLVLLKASRTMKLETIANTIMAMTAGSELQRELAARMQKVVQAPARDLSKTAPAQ